MRRTALFLPLMAKRLIFLALGLLTQAALGDEGARSELSAWARAWFPGAATVRAGDQTVGFLLLSDRIAPIPAYSGKPISALIGLDRQGAIRGVRVVAHQEPILEVGIADRDLARFTDQYAGLNAADQVRIGGPARPGYVIVDGLTGATITSLVVNSSVMQSARKVAERRGLLLPVDGDVGQGAPLPDPEPAPSHRPPTHHGSSLPAPPRIRARASTPCST